MHFLKTLKFSTLLIFTLFVGTFFLASTHTTFANTVTGSTTVYVGGTAVNCAGTWGACVNNSQSFTVTTPASGTGTACPVSPKTCTINQCNSDSDCNTQASTLTSGLGSGLFSCDTGTHQCKQKNVNTCSLVTLWGGTVCSNGQGTITASNCVIPNGGSTCPSTVSWSSWNTRDLPSWGRVAKQGGSSMEFNGNYGTQTSNISIGSTKFDLWYQYRANLADNYYQDVNLDSTVANAVCADPVGHAWNGTSCGTVSSCPSGQFNVNGSCWECSTGVNKVNGVCPTSTPVDCAGTWSCSSNVKTFTITTQPANGGVACPLSPIAGSCTANVDCAGTWGTCSNNSESFIITTPQSGTGAACPSSPRVATCETGSISGSDCVIPNGSSTCGIGVTWNIGNPGGSTGGINGPDPDCNWSGNFGSATCNRSPGSYDFMLQLGVNGLGTITKTASCAPGTVWIAGMCSDYDGGTLNVTDCAIAAGASTCGTDISATVQNATASSYGFIQGPNGGLPDKGFDLNYPNYQITYGANEFRLFKQPADYILTRVANARCAGSGTWSNGSCSIADSTTGDIYLDSPQPALDPCPIKIGKSTCNIHLHWYTVNPANYGSSHVKKVNSPGAGDLRFSFSPDFNPSTTNYYTDALYGDTSVTVGDSDASTPDIQTNTFSLYHTYHSNCYPSTCPGDAVQYYWNMKLFDYTPLCEDNSKWDGDSCEVPESRCLPPDYMWNGVKCNEVKGCPLPLDGTCPTTCVAPKVWDGVSCVDPVVCTAPLVIDSTNNTCVTPTSKLIVPDCPIGLNASTCLSSITWAAINPVGSVILKQLYNGVLSTITKTTSPMPNFLLSGDHFGQYKFTLNDNAGGNVNLEDTAVASCDTSLNLVWIGGKCQLAGTATVDFQVTKPALNTAVNPPVYQIVKGTSAKFTIAVTNVSNGGADCTRTSSPVDDPAFKIGAIVNTTDVSNPIKTTITVWPQVTTDYTITCKSAKAGDPDVSVMKKIVVKQVIDTIEQ